jgi:hypothetical protein
MDEVVHALDRNELAQGERDWWVKHTSTKRRSAGVNRRLDYVFSQIIQP